MRDISYMQGALVASLYYVRERPRERRERERERRR
jgi:hypothetical protein